MKKTSFIILLVMIIIISTACSVQNNVDVKNDDDIDLGTGNLKFKKEVGSKITTDNGLRILNYCLVLVNEYYFYKDHDERFGEDLLIMDEDLKTFTPQNDTEKTIVDDIKSSRQWLLDLKLYTLKLQKMEIESKLNLGNTSQEDIESMKKTIDKLESIIPENLNQLLDKYFAKGA